VLNIGVRRFGVRRFGVRRGRRSGRRCDTPAEVERRWGNCADAGCARRSVDHGGAV